MSLLVFNASNRVAHGVIRHLWKSGQFEKIVAADLYPSYRFVERFCRFRDDLDSTQSKVKLSDIQITDKSDLHHAISGSSHVLYVTHDYYSLVSSKLNLLRTTAQLTKQFKTQKVVALTPVEFDHYGEVDAFNTANKSEAEAKQVNPDLVHVECDLTFGKDSGVVQALLRRFANGESVKFSPSGEQPSPIHSEDLAAVVATLLTNNVKGQSYLAKGNRSYTWQQIVDQLAKAVGTKPTLNSSALENVVSPLSNNILSENLLQPCYRNLCQFINQYKAPTGGQDLKSFNLTLKEFDKVYAENSVKKEQYPPACNSLAQCLFL